MKIILSRHGNTFNPEDKVVWTGSSNDLELVAKGKEQAKILGEKLKATKISKIYSGPLKRTREYADIVLKNNDFESEIIIDKRLDEIDYGDWTGLSTEEVANQFDKKEQENWDKFSIFPQNANWSQTEEQIIREVKSFTTDLLSKHGANDLVLIVSSNGRLRYFFKLIENEFEKRITENNFKVKTGNLGLLNYQNKFHIDSWNISPLDLEI